MLALRRKLADNAAIVDKTRFEMVRLIINNLTLRPLKDLDSLTRHKHGLTSLSTKLAEIDIDYKLKVVRACKFMRRLT